MKSRRRTALQTSLYLAVAVLAGVTIPEPVLAQTPGAPLDGLERLKEGRSMRSSSSDPDWVNGNGDARPIPAGETLVIADLQGPGVITHIWNTIAAQEPGYSRLLVLRMYWDGEDAPSVESPIGDFFVIGHGIDVPFQSLPVVVSSDGRARNCYWPMPFRKSARITVTNEGRKAVNALYWYVDWRKLPDLPDDAAYFHAMYRQEYPAVSGRNYRIADIEGRGHYVGTVMNVRQHLGSWYGEGDDFWFIDGEEEPSLRGTGSEDYFCDAWGFRKFDGPYYGVPVWDNFKEMGKITAYRWHLTDPVSFERSLRVEIEHKGVTFNEDGSVKSGFEERADDFSSVAFWYQAEPHKPFEALPPAYDRLYVDYGNLVEGEALVEQAKATAGAILTQDGGWSGGKQFWWQPVSEGASLEVPVAVKENGNYELTLLMTHSWDYGIYQALLDGKPVGAPMDLWNESVRTEEYVFAVGPLTAGQRVLKFENKGKNKESEGYYFGLDGYVLKRR